MIVFGEIYTTGKKFYTAGGSDGSDKFHLCFFVFWYFSWQGGNDIAEGRRRLRLSRLSKSKPTPQVQQQKL